jgi:hypothetical protein
MSSNNQAKYSEYFKKRFANHDTAIKKIIEEVVIPKTSYRKKRNYQEAFAQGPAGTAFAQGFDQMPPYTRFSDELS